MLTFSTQYQSFQTISVFFINSLFIFKFQVTLLMFSQIHFFFLPSNFLTFYLAILTCFFLKAQEVTKANFTKDLQLIFCFLFAVMLVKLSWHIFIRFGSFSHLLLNLVHYF